jgi:3-dehydroquinate synthase
MVDASIGGKTGVDFRDRKNLLGSFYPAEKVCIYTDFLKTLPENEFKSGLAEIIKHAFLTGDVFIRFMEEQRAAVLSRDEGVMKDLIYRSLRVKADYVERDFKEAGCRAHLNFGHTFGHALETAAGLGRFSHGEAVAWGMYRAFRAGKTLNLTDPGYAERAEKLLRDYGYDLDFNDFDIDRYMDALSADKKKKGGQVRFILQSEPGETFITGIDADILGGILSGR